MVDRGALSDVFSLTSAAWSGVLVLGVIAWRLWNGLPAVMAQWVAWRQAKLAAQLAREKAINEAKDGDWTRLRAEVARLDQRLHDEITHSEQVRDAQEKENERCRSELASVREELASERAERMKLQAIMDGRGEVRNAAAAASAEVRMDARDKSDAAELKKGKPDG